MNIYLASGFIVPNSRTWKAKINQDKQPRRPSYVCLPESREVKVSWKATTKMKLSLTEKKVFYFKENFTF